MKRAKETVLGSGSTMASLCGVWMFSLGLCFLVLRLPPAVKDHTSVLNS